MSSEKIDLTHPRSTIITTEGFVSVSLDFEISSYIAAIIKMLPTQKIINEQYEALIIIQKNIDIVKKNPSAPPGQKEELIKALSECNTSIQALKNTPEIIEFKALREELSTNLLDGLSAQDLFVQDLVNAGLDAIVPPLSEFQKEQVINSAASTILKGNFVELLKNSFDVVISECLTRNVDKLLKITLDIDVRTEGQVTFRLKDNGLGFSEGMLDKLSSHDRIIGFCTYVEKKEASKKVEKSGSPPPYSFGGRGLGLHIFLLQALLGSRHITGGMEQLFEVDRLTALRVGNAEDGGALFEFTTSLDPLRPVLAADSSESFSQESDSESEEEVTLAPLPIGRAMPKAGEGAAPPVSAVQSLASKSFFKARKPPDLDLEKDKTAESEHLKKPFD